MKSDEKVGLDFNVLGMLDIQGISNFSKKSTILSTFEIYSEFISLIEENVYFQKYEDSGLKRFLIGDALFFYFDNDIDVLKRVVYLISSLYSDIFLRTIHTSINCNDIPLGFGNGNRATFKNLIAEGYLSADGEVQERFSKLDRENLNDFLIESIELKDYEKKKIFECIDTKVNMPCLSVRAALSAGSVYGQKDFPIISKLKDTFDILLGSAVSRAVDWEKKQKWFGMSANNEFEKIILVSELSEQLSDLKQDNYLIEYAVPTNMGLVKTLAVNFIKKSCAEKINQVVKEKIAFYKAKDDELFFKMYGTSQFVEYVVNKELFISEQF
ncbi:MAG: hypothetical protein K8S27_11525 [Candidatus Omnitrophica bacterium]|nr:hypothetical protein [Candidatus Omnitrophota bacterium]